MKPILAIFWAMPIKGYQVTYAIQEVETNKFFQVDFVVQSPDRGRAVISKMTAMYYQTQITGGQP